jgi:hypothetical protein
VLIDARGIPAPAPSTGAMPTPLVLPEKELPPPVTTLGERATPRISWTHAVEPTRELPVPLVARYWAEGPRTYLGKECVIVRGITRGRTAAAGGRPGIEVLGRLTVAFDPESGVSLRTSSETRVAHAWPVNGTSPLKRVSRETTLKAQLLGTAPWAEGAAPGPPIPRSSPRPSGSGLPAIR